MNKEIRNEAIFALFLIVALVVGMLILAEGNRSLKNRESSLEFLLQKAKQQAKEAKEDLQNQKNAYNRMNVLISFLSGGSPVACERGYHQLSFEEARNEFASLLYASGGAAIFPVRVPGSVLGFTQDGHFRLLRSCPLTCFGDSTVIYSMRP